MFGNLAQDEVIRQERYRVFDPQCPKKNSFLYWKVNITIPSQTKMINIVNKFQEEGTFFKF